MLTVKAPVFACFTERIFYLGMYSPAILIFSIHVIVDLENDITSDRLNHEVLLAYVEKKILRIR